MQTVLFDLNAVPCADPNKLDFFKTPFPVLDAVFSGRVIPRLRAPRILDTGAADGRWGRYAAGYFTDVVELHGAEFRDVPKPGGFTHWHCGNYLTMSLEAGYDVIVGNPPFNQAEQFVMRSLELLAPGGSLFYLLKAQLLGSADRFNYFWGNTPLRRIYYCTDRIGFLDHVTTEEVWDYAIFHWQQGAPLFAPPQDVPLRLWNYKRYIVK